MSKLGITLFICACVLIAGWLWQQVQECEYPLHYRIGQVDEKQFHLSELEYRDLIQEAGNLWEEALGRKLFIYDPTADFTVNLIYDERQQATATSQELAHKMHRTENSNQKVRDRYNYWQEIFQSRNHDYEAARENYDTRLAAFNATVEEWNSKGGVPADKADALNAEREALHQMYVEFEAKRNEIAEIARTLESLQAQSESLLASYNSSVHTYNELYGVKTPFHKGEYDGESISIFQYHNKKDLLLVLAHEMGHALGIEHVESPEAIMHGLMGSQNLDDLTPTQADIDAVNITCGADK